MRQSPAFQDAERSLASNVYIHKRSCSAMQLTCTVQTDVV